MRQMKLGLVNLALACVCFIIATGCASYSVRTGAITGKETEGLYAGTRVDGGLTVTFAKGLFDRETWPFMVFISPIAIPLCIGDGALSAVVDTICLPYDLTHQSDLPPKPVVQREERPEIQKLRQLWPQAYFKGDILPTEGPWLCNVVVNHVTLEHYRQCLKTVLDCGWILDNPAGLAPSSIPGPFTTIPESFHRDGRTLTVYFMDCGVRLRSK